MTGKLILCGTPIGNLEDISQRALRVLKETDVLACEDTRRTKKLLSHFGIRPRRLSVYNDTNERRQSRELIKQMRQGRTVALVADAGMPGLSDPGYRLVRACAEAGVPVEVVPGPTAVVSALSVSGLPAGRFVFEGFLPRKTGDRKRRIAALGDEVRTLVIFVSPHHIEAHLGDLLEGLGERPAALVRELTKMHEEVRRGSLSELLDGVRADPPRGEIVLVVGGCVRDQRPGVDAAELARRAGDLMEAGVDRAEALSRVAQGAGVARRAVFDALVEQRRKGSTSD